MTRIGFIGLGTMGSAMAARLVGAGFDVEVWNRSPEAAASLVAQGATLVESAQRALAAPVSFSMLANDDAVDRTLTTTSFAGEPGRIHVNMSSISGSLATRLVARAADAGVTYVAAPVLGRPAVAAAGKLNVLVAGPSAAVTSLEPFLSVIGVRTWDLGSDPASANVVKIAVNYNILHALQAIGESVALVERNGVNGGEFIELLGSTLFGGVVYQGYGKIVAERSYLPAGFTLALGLKDLALAEEAASDVDFRLPSSPAIRETFESALANPALAEADWSSIAEVLRPESSVT